MGGQAAGPFPALDSLASGTFLLLSFKKIVHREYNLWGPFRSMDSSPCGPYRRRGSGQSATYTCQSGRSKIGPHMNHL
jgi:hypothetical protein